MILRTCQRLLFLSALLGAAGCGLPWDLFGPSDRDREGGEPGGILAERIVPADQSEVEQQVFALINQARAEGRRCGPVGTFASVPPLVADGRLA